MGGLKLISVVWGLIFPSSLFSLIPGWSALPPFLGSPSSCFVGICSFEWGVPASTNEVPFQDSAWGTLLYGARSSVSCWPPQIPFCGAIHSLIPPLPSNSASVQVPGSLRTFQTVHTKACCFLWISCRRKCRRPAWSLVSVRNIDSHFSSFLTVRAARKQEVDRQMGSGDVWAVCSFPDLSSVDCILSVLPFASLKYVRPWGFQISIASSFLSQQLLLVFSLSPHSSANGFAEVQVWACPLL